MNQLEFYSPLPVEELLGSQKILILGPSLGTTHEAWSRSLSFIGDDIKPVVFDLPGHGRTKEFDADWSIEDLADQVIALADRLEVRQFSYAGLSLSGAVGYALAINHSSRLSSVSIIGSAPKLGSQDSWRAREEQVLELGTKSLVAQTSERWFTSSFAERKPEVVEQFMQMLATIPKQSYAQACRALAKFDVWDQISEIDIPTLIVHAGEDKVVSLQDAERANGLIQGSGLIEISGVAHQAAAEAPEVTIKHVSFYARKFR
jgi:3-oxoadipate enol-lactonase